MKVVKKPETTNLASFYASLAQTFDYLSNKGFREFIDYGVRKDDGLTFYFHQNAFNCLERNKPLSYYHLTLHPLCIVYNKNQQRKVKEISLNINATECNSEVEIE